MDFRFGLRIIGIGTLAPIVKVAILAYVHHHAAYAIARHGFHRFLYLLLQHRNHFRNRDCTARATRVVIST